MPIRVEHLRSLLGPALDEFWLAGRAGQRYVSYVTVVQDWQESADCQGGELALVTPSGTAGPRVLDLVDELATRQAAAVLIPTPLVPAADWRRLRDLVIRRGWAAGLLAADADPRTIANVISRALHTTVRPELALAALHGANALQDLAETLGRLVGNSVTIETPHHELLAFSSMHGPVDRPREETILRRRADPRIIAWKAREGYLAAIHTSDRPVRIPSNPEFGFSGRVAMRVVADEEILAIIWVMDTARPLDARDHGVIHQAAEAAAAILLRQRVAAQREAQLQTEFLEDVLHGRIADVENTRAVARSLGWDIDRLQQVLVVAIDHFEAFRLQHASQSGRRLQRMRERLTEIVRLETLAVDPEAIIGPRSSDVIVLYTTEHPDEASRHAAGRRLAERIVQRVRDLIPDMSVTVGMGREFSSIEHVAARFREAELAARFAMALRGGNHAIHYGDLGIYRVLITLQEHEEMITPALRRLVEHDRRHHTDYVRTLAAYYACLGHRSAAAQRLAIHRNTLNYRMDRIADVIGISLDDPDNRLVLELGLRLLELRHTTGAAAPAADTGHSDPGDTGRGVPLG